MRYTTLKVIDEGVVLWDHHLRRLQLSQRARAALEAFAQSASAGVWAVRVQGDDVRLEARPGSRLFDGIPVRVAVSPFAGESGAFAKPAPPCSYDAVRAPGVATLLTSRDGAEIFESCVAATIGWNGTRLVLVPDDRPRVASVAIAAIREHLAFDVAPLRVDGEQPLALVNAVRGICLPSLVEGRAPFPMAAAKQVSELFLRLARRP